MHRYQIFDHTADIGINVFGKTLKELFVNGAYALFDLMIDLKGVRQEEVRSIAAEGLDVSELWVNYLRECLYLFHGEALLLSDCHIDAITHKHVTATLRGEFYDPARHEIRQDIKAVTYHQATIQETPQGWSGKVIFDV